MIGNITKRSKIKPFLDLTYKLFKSPFSHFSSPLLSLSSTTPPHAILTCIHMLHTCMQSTMHRSTVTVIANHPSRNKHIIDPLIDSVYRNNGSKSKPAAHARTYTRLHSRAHLALVGDLIHFL